MTHPLGVSEPPIPAPLPTREKAVLAPQLCLIGEFSLETEGAPVSLPHIVQRLLAFLAVHDHPVTRAYAAGSLWPEVPQERAAGNLRTTLWRLRRTRDDVVEASAMTVALSPGVAVDLHQLYRDLRAGFSGSDAPELQERLAGDLLPNWYDEWLIVARERLRQLRLHALEALSLRYLEQGLTSRAIDVGLTAVAADPLRESAHRILVRAHLVEGNVIEAIREYENFAAVLRDDLGIGPSTAMQELIQPLLHSGTRHLVSVPS